MGFTDAVKKEMAVKKLRISDLARMTGYTYTHCHDLLHGKKRWNQTSIDRFCKALGIKIIYVSDETPNHAPTGTE